MSEYTLYHNPRCSKSRQAKALLDEQGVAYETRLYLQDPLNTSELKALVTKLGIEATELLRTKEAEYKEAGLSKNSTAEEAIEAMANFPKLMERPVLTGPKGARIGRPPEAILDIL
ncbi:arsenate reductase (glutaredoxin) [Saccharospirillum salsuginis]|uniref:Arsenate reductase n=1 Tax=Saccharospirillum salsuginis TaxID=418750 RepID=A0A918N984_9GAMM|nr:arsenate reductase (glutaredoxin) [Saccharospirillum salsuginis]GGX51028.1 arsenate reductase [Saccharospirillum salsuginis]